MEKINILYIDGSTEEKQIISHSIPETTLKAAKETGKQVINVTFIE